MTQVSPRNVKTPNGGEAMPTTVVAVTPTTTWRSRYGTARLRRDSSCSRLAESSSSIPRVSASNVSRVSRSMRPTVRRIPPRSSGPMPSVDRCPFPATVVAVPPLRSSRSPFVRLLCLVVLFLPLAGCTTQRIVVLERPPAVSVAANPAPVIPVERLEVSLRRFLLSLLDGRSTDLMLAGDRFVVVTPVDLVEVTSLRARGDVRMIALGVPGGCPGGCHVLFEEFFTALRDDLASPDALRAQVTAEPPLRDWPTLEVVSASRRWRVSFDETGRSLFVVELLAGPLDK